MNDKIMENENEAFLKSKRFKRDDGSAVPTAARANVLLVDPDDNSPIADVKKTTLPPNTDLKLKSYLLIMSMWVNIFFELGLPDVAFYDLMVSCEISSIIAAAHTIFRQSTTNKGSFGARNDNKASSVTIALSKVAKTYAEFYQHLELKSVQEQQAFNGCFQPLLFLTLLFKDRYRGTRVSPSTKTTKKGGAEEKAIPLSQYGIMPAHVVFNDGMTLSPFISSSLAQSMGLSICLINLNRSQKEYKRRWKHACKRLTSHLGDVSDAVIAHVGTKKANEVAPIIGKLLDLCLLRGTRQAHNFFLICNMFNLFQKIYFMLHYLNV